MAWVWGEGAKAEKRGRGQKDLTHTLLKSLNFKVIGVMIRCSTGKEPNELFLQQVVFGSHMEDKWWWGWTGVEKGLQRSANCTVQLGVQVRGDDGLTYSWKGLFLPCSSHCQLLILPTPSPPASGLGPGDAELYQMMPTILGLGKHFHLHWATPKGKVAFSRGPHAEHLTAGKKKKNWMTLFGATIGTMPTCHIILFKKGNKKEQVKGKMEKRKVVKVQNRC